MTQSPSRAGSVLFAAGRGKRLRPLTDALPKPCLPLLGAPLAAWALESLVATRPPVVVNASHLADALIGCLEVAARPDVTAFVEGPEALGTAGTLKALERDLADPVLTWNADLLSDLDPADLLSAHEAAGAPATLAVQLVDEHADFEIDGGRVARFFDRRDVSAPGARFIGAAIYHRAALDGLPNVAPSGLGEALLRPLAQTGDLAIHVHPGYAADVGTTGRYLAASLDLLEGRAPEPPRALPGEVVEVRGGRAFVGSEAAAHPDSLGPGAIVLPGARVESGARVERSVVWPGEVVPAATSLEGVVWFGGMRVTAA